MNIERVKGSEDRLKNGPFYLCLAAATDLLLIQTLNRF